MTIDIRQGKGVLRAALWTLGAGIRGVAFLCAAIAKASNPGVVAGVLVWLGVPDGALLGTIVMLVILESVIAAGLWFAGDRVVARWIALGLLAIFSGLLAVLVFSAKPPSCACFGKMIEFRSAKTEALFGIGRNLALAGLILLPGVVRRE